MFLSFFLCRSIGRGFHPPGLAAPAVLQFFSSPDQVLHGTPPLLPIFQTQTWAIFHLCPFPALRAALSPRFNQGTLQAVSLFLCFPPFCQCLRTGRSGVRWVVFPFSFPCILSMRRSPSFGATLRSVLATLSFLAFPFAFCASFLCLFHPSPALSKTTSLQTPPIYVISFFMSRWGLTPPWPTTLFLSLPVCPVHRRSTLTLLPIMVLPLLFKSRTHTLATKPVIKPPMPDKPFPSNLPFFFFPVSLYFSSFSTLQLSFRLAAVSLSVSGETCPRVFLRFRCWLSFTGRIRVLAPGPHPPFSCLETGVLLFFSPLFDISFSGFVFPTCRPQLVFFLSRSSFTLSCFLPPGPFPVPRIVGLFRGTTPPPSRPTLSKAAFNTFLKIFPGFRAHLFLHAIHKRHPGFLHHPWFVRDPRPFKSLVTAFPPHSFRPPDPIFRSFFTQLWPPLFSTSSP